MPIKLENWFVKFKSEYSLERRVCGEVYGHPAHKDGNLISISTARYIEGRKITTINESVYILGEPKADYLDFLKCHGIPYDPEQPIKMVGEYTQYGQIQS